MKRILVRLMIMLVAFALGIFVAGLWAARPSDGNANPMSKASRLGEEADIVEAVFRYQLQWNKQRKVCFLTVEGREPSEDFLKRFVGQTEPRIQRISRRKYDRRDRIVDADTGEVAEFISVVSIPWMSDTKAEVHCNVYDGAGSLGEYTLQVNRESDQWVVKSCLDMSEFDPLLGDTTAK